MRGTGPGIGWTQLSSLEIWKMDSLFGAWQTMIWVAPVVVWLIWLYLIVRFLRAFEAGVRAHERVADALTNRSPRPPEA